MAVLRDCAPLLAHVTARSLAEPCPAPLTRLRLGLLPQDEVTGIGRRGFQHDANLEQLVAAEHAGCQALAVLEARDEYVIKQHKLRLSYADLNVDSPYNTYRHTGLPPGPIDSPGLASLKAAAAPADTHYLYYVLTGKDGSHTFARTPEEFATGSLPGARNIPVDKFDQKMRDIKKDKALIVVCATSSRAGRAAAQLRARDMRRFTCSPAV